MEAADTLTIISAVLNFLLGGTTIWSILKWLGERKLRQIGLEEKETELEGQRFEALTRQIEYQRQLIAQYIDNERAKDELDDRQRELIRTLKRNQLEMETEKMELERRLAISKTLECHRKDCQQRIKCPAANAQNA